MRKIFVCQLNYNITKIEKKELKILLKFKMFILF